MPASQWVHLLHWGIYLASFAAFGLLLTRWRRYGAAYIALLFAIQTVWGGCPLTSLENRYRAQEGRAPLTGGMLTDNITSNRLYQELISGVTAFAAAVLIVI